MLGRDGTLRISNDCFGLLETDCDWIVLTDIDWDWTGMRAGAGLEAGLGTNTDCLLTLALGLTSCDRGLGTYKNECSKYKIVTLLKETIRHYKI